MENKLENKKAIMKHKHNYKLICRVNRKAPNDYDPVDTKRCECGNEIEIDYKNNSVVKIKK